MKRTMRVTWRSAERPWPADLGPLVDFPSRYPPETRNEDAARLVALARPLVAEFGPDSEKRPNPALSAFFQGGAREQTSAKRSIGAQPDAVTQFLETNAEALDAIREHLLRAELVWDRDLSQGYVVPLPNPAAHLQLNRVLVVRALANRSWDDLHAAWRLTKALRSRPEMVPQWIGMVCIRVINATAWRLPSPAPVWLDEVLTADHAWLFARGMQADTWAHWVFNAERNRLKGRNRSPFARFALARMIDGERRAATVLLNNRDCALDTQRFFEKHSNEPFGSRPKEMISLWRAVFRYRVEREATKNVLRIDAGEPIVESSDCSEGTWSFTNGVLAFSRELPTVAPQVDMPLTLHVKE